MKKAKHNSVCIHCHLIRVKDYRGGGRLFIVKDLNTGWNGGIPDFLAGVFTELADGSYVTWVREDHKQIDKMKALTLSEREGLKTRKIA